eukprot:TRINITY_DN40194_c0_g1_i1.p1 TRINITY_DN40194_c0_g1~~TRINITY_DN40194_c0_g1_i1.p1  ORF type:complete len:1196 (-),score=438.97 TRINITY_DN40194_c0_g1_i1:23-3610(-)
MVPLGVRVLFAAGLLGPLCDALRIDDDGADSEFSSTPKAPPRPRPAPRPPPEPAGETTPNPGPLQRQPVDGEDAVAAEPAVARAAASAAALKAMAAEKKKDKDSSAAKLEQAAADAAAAAGRQLEQSPTQVLLLAAEGARLAAHEARGSTLEEVVKAATDEARKMGGAQERTEKEKARLLKLVGTIATHEEEEARLAPVKEAGAVAAAASKKKSKTPWEIVAAAGAAAFDAAKAEHKEHSGESQPYARSSALSEQAVQEMREEAAAWSAIVAADTAKELKMSPEEVAKAAGAAAAKSGKLADMEPEEVAQAAGKAAARAMQKDGLEATEAAKLAAAAAAAAAEDNDKPVAEAAVAASKAAVFAMALNGQAADLQLRAAGDAAWRELERSGGIPFEDVLQATSGAVTDFAKEHKMRPQTAFDAAADEAELAARAAKQSKAEAVTAAGKAVELAAKAYGLDENATARAFHEIMQHALQSQHLNMSTVWTDAADDALNSAHERGEAKAVAVAEAAHAAAHIAQAVDPAERHTIDVAREAAVRAARQLQMTHAETVAAAGAAVAKRATLNGDASDEVVRLSQEAARLTAEEINRRAAVVEQALARAEKYGVPMSCQNKSNIDPKDIFAVTVQPGDLGLRYHMNKDGDATVTVVDKGGQAEKVGVQPNMVIYKVALQPFSEAELKKREMGKEPYSIAFLYPSGVEAVHVEPLRRAVPYVKVQKPVLGCHADEIVRRVADEAERDARQQPRRKGAPPAGQLAVAEASDAATAAAEQLGERPQDVVKTAETVAMRVARDTAQAPMQEAQLVAGAARRAAESLDEPYSEVARVAAQAAEDASMDRRLPVEKVELSAGEAAEDAARQQGLTNTEVAEAAADAAAVAAKAEHQTRKMVAQVAGREAAATAIRMKSPAAEVEDLAAQEAEAQGLRSGEVPKAVEAQASDAAKAAARSLKRSPAEVSEAGSAAARRAALAENRGEVLRVSRKQAEELMERAAEAARTAVEEAGNPPEDYNKAAADAAFSTARAEGLSPKEAAEVVAKTSSSGAGASHSKLEAVPKEVISQTCQTVTDGMKVQTSGVFFARGASGGKKPKAMQLRKGDAAPSSGIFCSSIDSEAAADSSQDEANTCASCSGGCRFGRACMTEDPDTGIQMTPDRCAGARGHWCEPNPPQHLAAEPEKPAGPTAAAAAALTHAPREQKD